MRHHLVVLCPQVEAPDELDPSDADNPFHGRCEVLTASEPLDFDESSVSHFG